MLAIHGVGGGAYFFRGLADRIGSCRVTAIDLPGTGHSTAAQPPTFDGWVADIAELIERELARPVVILGHSIGTILALALWRARPEWIRGLIFAGGLPAARPAVRERLKHRIDAIASEGIAGWGARISPAVFGPRALTERPEVVGLFERLIEAVDVRGYLRSLEILIEADAGDIVPAVTAPCGSIGGSDDQYAPPEDVAAFLQRLPRPARSIVLPGVGHMPFFEAPAEFAAAVGALLEAT